MQDDARHELLYPSWATSRNGPRYDDLSDVDKEVWRKTREQREDADSVVTWLEALTAAVRLGEITQDDAERAIKRVVP